MCYRRAHVNGKQFGKSAHSHRDNCKYLASIVTLARIYFIEFQTLTWLNWCNYVTELFMARFSIRNKVSNEYELVANNNSMVCISATWRVAMKWIAFYWIFDWYRTAIPLKPSMLMISNGLRPERPPRHRIACLARECSTTRWNEAMQRTQPDHRWFCKRMTLTSFYESE